MLGSDPIEEQVVDSIGEAVRDITDAYARCRDDPWLLASFFTSTLPKSLKYIDHLAARYSTSRLKDTLVGDGLTLADLQLHQLLSRAPSGDQAAVTSMLDQCPRVKAAVANVATRPEILAWIAKRPA